MQKKKKKKNIEIECFHHPHVLYVEKPLFSLKSNKSTL
jgi:hypothetical protein